MKTKSTTIDPYLNYDDDYIYSDPFGTGFISKLDYLTDDFHEMIGTYLLTLKILNQVYDIAAFINLFINIPHLFILTRKELRSNLVYIAMIGICLCDLIHSIGKISQIFMTWHLIYKVENCEKGYPYTHLMVDIFGKCMQIMSRRCSGLLALFIAGFRTFSVLFPMSNAVSFMMKPKFGYLIVLVVMVICVAWSSLYRITTIIVKLAKCQNCVVPSWPIYQHDTNGKSELSLRVIDGYIAIVVCILYFFVTGALVGALYQANKRRKHLRNEKSSNTSQLVIAMAVLMFLSESAYGAIFITVSYFFVDFREREYFEQLEVGAMTLSIINSIAHCFICFSMSSQYRDVVKGIIGYKKKIDVRKVASIEKLSTHPTTLQTTSRRTF